MGNVCNNTYGKKSVGISYNEMNISSVIDHMSDIYINDENCYSIIYLKMDILTIINRHDYY